MSLFLDFLFYSIDPIVFSWTNKIPFLLYFNVFVAHCPVCRLTAITKHSSFHKTQNKLIMILNFETSIPKCTTPSVCLPHYRLHFFFLRAGLLVRAILKLPSLWKCSCHYYSFLQTKQNKNMLLPSSRTRYFSKWGRKAWSLGTTCGRGWGSANPGAADTGPEQGGWGRRKGGIKKTLCKMNWVSGMYPLRHVCPFLHHPSVPHLSRTGV